ncbi:MAG TPA: hypothetical protein VFK86_18420 [Bauldia sp.]|nr:hypothetical protein [Bauldia sp.]
MKRPSLRKTEHALVALMAAGLAACAAVDEKTIADNSGVSAPKSEATAADFVMKSSYCPPIQIRAGTATMTVYERGHENESAYVRYLASISQTARECTMVGDTLTIKVGIAGRVVAGPKGSAANITLPLRIAVAKQFGGTGPLYSELFKIPVSLTAPTFGANYNQVFDQVTVTAGPNDRNLIIYVGFDEGPKA